MSDVGRYRKIYPRIWRHPGFKALTPSSQKLALYLLSGPQTNPVGLFHFSPALAADDLGVATETLRKGLTDVRETFGWLFDAGAGVFYIPSWWRWNKPEGVNVLKGNLKELSEIPPSHLMEMFAANLRTLPEALHLTFIEGCRERLPEPSPIQDQEQDQEQKQEQEQEGAGAPKSGIDEDAYLRTVIREALGLSPKNAPTDYLLDCINSIDPTLADRYKRQDVLQHLNQVLLETRAAVSRGLRAVQ